MGRSKNHSLDEAFLKALTDSVFANLNNEKFDVNVLAKEVGISRSQIHRKLHKISGKSMSRFVCEIRLEEALRLLREEVGTASEISFQVGFTSPAYFNKCFHDYYGYPPGEVKNRIREKRNYNYIGKGNASTNPHSVSREIIVPKTTFIKKRLPYYIITGIVLITLTVLIDHLIIGRVSQKLEKSIAVLPFTTITKDSTSQYIADGVREAILTKLNQIKGLDVGSRTSSEIYLNSNKRIPKIARELGVATIMEGSAQKFGDKIRITIQLIDGKTDKHIWSENYDRTWGDIYSIYTEIAENVANKLQVVITSEEKLLITKAPSMGVTYYDYFLQASAEQWKYWDGDHDTAALNRAEMLYNRIFKLDPKNAKSWIYKGSIYIDRYSKTEKYYENNFLDSVLWYCDKAMVFDPESDFAHFQKGMVYHITGDSEMAFEYYEKARFLNQNDAKVLYETLWRLGYLYLNKKEHAKGLSFIRLAVKKARGSPKDFRHMLGRLGDAYMYIGSYKEAENYLTEARDLGDICLSLWNLETYQGKFQESLGLISTCCSENNCTYQHANTYLQLKEYKKSIKYFEKLRKDREVLGLIQQDNLYREGFALQQTGYHKEGMDLIEQQLALLDKKRSLGRPDGYDYHYAAIYASRGDFDMALEHLKAYKNKVLYPSSITNIIPIDFIQYDIMFDSIRERAEFQKFVSQIEKEKEAIGVLVRRKG